MAGLAGGAFRGTTQPSPVTPFCIDSTEVTADAYKACVNARKCTADNVTCDQEASKWATYAVPGRGQHPMNCVSWEQAVGYCAAQGKRLPSIHEWEWAARSGLEARKYPWGNGDLSTAQFCKEQGTCPVGSFPNSDSAQRVHDLAGNVSEWVSDVAQGWQHFKGGAWNSAWDGRDLAVSYTFDHWPANKPDRFPYVGFRCARNAGP